MSYNNDDLHQKLDDIENKMYQLEEKIDKINVTLEKHIGFIDDTYKGLRNPIKAVRRMLGE
tara:strand:+ start:317 stop:499 length:183 start_codon:yes stop_codon:yes gene_type:complete